MKICLTYFSRESFHFYTNFATRKRVRFVRRFLSYASYVSSLSCVCRIVSGFSGIINQNFISVYLQILRLSFSYFFLSMERLSSLEWLFDVRHFRCNSRNFRPPHGVEWWHVEYACVYRLQQQRMAVFYAEGLNCPTVSCHKKYCAS